MEITNEEILQEIEPLRMRLTMKYIICAKLGLLNHVPEEVEVFIDRRMDEVYGADYSKWPGASRFVL